MYFCFVFGLKKILDILFRDFRARWVDLRRSRSLKKISSIFKWGTTFGRILIKIWLWSPFQVDFLSELRAWRHASFNKMFSLVANLVIDTIEQSLSDDSSSDGPFDYEMTVKHKLSKIELVVLALGAYKIFSGTSDFTRGWPGAY